MIKKSFDCTRDNARFLKATKKKDGKPEGHTINSSLDTMRKQKPRPRKARK